MIIIKITKYKCFHYKINLLKSQYIIIHQFITKILFSNFKLNPHSFGGNIEIYLNVHLKVLSLNSDML